VTPDEQKRLAGEAAAALVEPGMTVGLGTGSTAAHFVRALAARGLTDIRGVATSEATAAQAHLLGIPLLDLNQAGRIDLTVDGADEISADLTLIKGGGAALLREKLVWEASCRCVTIADASKSPSAAFGRFPLPIEVVAFGHLTTAARIDAALRRVKIEARAILRELDGVPVMTDGGNVVYDAACGAIPDPRALAAELKSVIGVVEHGLFIGLTERALIGTDDGVVTLLT
jgi:ribose 5-phosphate isomerase A